jgi:DHA3 family macrolide efflux protein-like MFS transporter
VPLAAGAQPAKDQKPAPTPSYRTVLRNSGYRRLLFGQVISIWGDFLALFAVMDLLAFRLHAGPAAVIMLSFWALLPQAMFSPIAGGLVDRWDFKRTLVGSDFARALLVTPLLFFHQLPVIYVIFMGLGIGSSLFSPARSILMKLLVADEELIAANGLLQQAFLLSRMLAMPAAGLLVAFLGPTGCFRVDIASFLISGLMILSIPVRRPPKPERKWAHFGTDLREGLRFLVGSPALSGMVCALGMALFAGSSMTPLLALYVRDRMPTNSLFFGILAGLVGAGAIAGIQTIPVLRRRFDDFQLVLWGLMTLAGSALLMALLQSEVLVAGGAFGIGFGIGLILTPAQTLLQRRTPLPVLGRVSSAVDAVISLAQLGGMVLSGACAQAAGIRAVFLGCTLLTGASAIVLKAVRAKRPADFPA